MKISIVTPTLNQEPFLERTIRSVLDQDCDGLEYIVIDGGSTDRSVEIIRRYEKHLAWWMSEKDRGQAHAINKGLARATGDVFAFINGDDFYLPGAFRAVSGYLSANPSCQWLCGETVLFGPSMPAALSLTRVPKTAAHALSWDYRAPQPGMFWKRSILGAGFDEQWNYCFDNELYVRLLLAGHRCEHMPIPVAAYRHHPASKTVAESRRFDLEFDAIAEKYEKQLQGSQRRWTVGTLLLRRSCQASEAGDARTAMEHLWRSLLIHPEGMLRRLFWGTSRRALHAAAVRYGFGGGGG